MKKLFVVFYRKMWASINLSFQTQMEYRVNAAIDWCMNPLISTVAELLVWGTLFSAMGVKTLAGYTQDYYLSYVTWSVFFSRIAANWMYEYRMIQEIETGTVNAILVRPMGFYEFYLGQYLGYKIPGFFLSIWIPILLAFFLGGTSDFSRLPLAALLLFCYVVFAHTLSFCLATLAFRFTKVSSFGVTKNFLIWLASGELFPLDLMPRKLQIVMDYLPFQSGCYLPVGYLTHRLGLEALLRGVGTTIFWTLVVGGFASVLWRRGLQSYAGTGA